jgi:putative inorganic carbon (hco3(-)) transporter
VIIARYTFIILVLTRASLDLLLGQASLGEGGLTLGAGLNVIILAVGLAALVCGYRAPLRMPALIWAPYLGIALLSLAYTPDFSGGVRLFLSTLTFPAMFLSAFALLRSENDMIVFLRAIVYSSVIPTLYGVLQIVSGAAPDFRVNATFGHANIFAFYIVAVLVAILYHNIFAGRATSLIWRYGSRIYFFVLLGLLVATRTPSAWIEVVFIFAAYAITVNRKLLLALPLVPLLLLVPQVSDRLTDLDTGILLPADTVRRRSP